ncbi:fimbrial protein [Serratia aquatilis]|uniref:Fimbrial protein n=1 Tax=Serratia aquatilis TaxID=1737515 RepID=A0ABV6EIL5_9GAMM
MRQRAVIGCALTLLMVIGSTLPAQAVIVNFSGTLVVPPPCVINGNSNITVSFGHDLLASRVDGVNYAQVIPYVLDCTGATSTSLRLQLQGGGAGFNPQVLATSKSNLGLALRSNGSPLAVNSWLSFVDPARPVLTAVPVKASGSTLNGGAFTAMATLLVDYQ